MLTPNDIETQLSQRRLDVENLNLQIRQLQSGINSIKSTIDSLNTKATPVNSGNSAQGGPTINNIVTTFLKAVTFVAAVTFNALANFTSGIFARNTTGASQIQLNGVDSSDNGLYLCNRNNLVSFISTGSSFNGTNHIAKQTTAALLRFGSNSIGFYLGSGLTIGNSWTPTLNLAMTDTTLGFFGATAAAKQTLNSYSTNTQGSAYSGIATGVGGSPYAQVNDLNTLRVAYENLRASYDDLRTKLQTTTLVG